MMTRKISVRRSRSQLARDYMKQIIYSADLKTLRAGHVLGKLQRRFGDKFSISRWTEKINQLVHQAVCTELDETWASWYVVKSDCDLGSRARMELRRIMTNTESCKLTV